MSTSGPSTPYRIAGMASAVVLALGIGIGLVGSLRSDGRLPSISILPNPQVQAYANRGEWGRVVVELEAQLRMGVERAREPIVYAALGHALGQLGRRPEAIERYRSALALRPDDIDLRLALLVELGAEERLGELVAEAQEILARDPGRSDVRVHLGAAHERLGRIELAAAEYERAAADGDLAAAHLNLGRVRTAQGDLARAMPSLERAVELRPDLADAHAALGRAHAAAGRPREAIAAYRRAVELAPDRVDLQKTLAALEASAGDI